jgi:hypothetical protein
MGANSRRIEGLDANFVGVEAADDAACAAMKRLPALGDPPGGVYCTILPEPRLLMRPSSMRIPR